MTFHKYLGDSKMFEYEKHYKECQQQNKPFIKSKINPIHGNYTINVDLMPCNYVFSESDQIKIEQLIQNEKKFVNSNSQKPFNDYTIDEELIWIDGVSSEHMHYFCNSIYDLSQKFHN